MHVSECQLVLEPKNDPRDKLLLKTSGKLPPIKFVSGLVSVQMLIPSRPNSKTRELMTPFLKLALALAQFKRVLLA